MTPPEDRDDRTETSEQARESPLPAGIPRKIGHYKLQSVIASGGMGTVYKAVQESPRRVVAIKVMKAGVTSGSALRRFEYESQLLGRLRHPGIAQVYEAGTYDDGTGTVPYFAMEYIPNAKSIAAYTREKKLGTRQTLALFAKVCDAVHHGHQKGIVHRDLKPGNILVGPNGNPRIIDFGVARATDADLALTLQQTDVGALVGTVQYMSPEQCEADPHDIDTRSDVYALGVVLYQLLCGKLPYEISKTPIYEATRVIREQNPTKPSSLNPKLRGELETIVLKTIEKDRDRRYQSAAELAQDIARYLAGDAITARPASLGYQLRVFARRNKGALAALATIFVVVLAGAIVSTALYFRSETNRVRAEQQQQKARAAETYLGDLVASINPLTFGENVRVSDLLNSYEKTIEERFDQPEVEATVRAALGRSYIFLNLTAEAGRSEEHWQAADDNLSAAVEIRREILGPGHPDTLEVIEEMARFLGYGRDLERAERLRREAFEIREKQLGIDDPETLAAGYSLSSLLRKRDKLDEAEALALRVLDRRRELLGEDASLSLSAMAQLAGIRQAQGELDDAERMKLEVLDARRRISGDESKAVESALADVAHVYVAQGKIDQALDLYGAPVSSEELGVEKWLRDGVQPLVETPTVLVFWESWCPYSQAYIPQVQTLSAAYSDGSLQIIGLNSLGMNTSEDQAAEFIERNRLGFPNAVCNGKAHGELGFTGYPAAVALKDGRIVWKGHPNALSREFLDGLAGS